MFQLGSLVVLCSLLTGTSASLPEFIKKLDVPVSFSEKIEYQDGMIKNNFVHPDDSETLRRLNDSYWDDLRNIFSERRKRDLQPGLSSNDNGTEMKMPLILDSSVYLANDNPRNNTTIFLKLQCSLRVERESQNSQSYVTMWKCSNETMKDITDSSGRLVPNGSL